MNIYHGEVLEGNNAGGMWIAGRCCGQGMWLGGRRCGMQAGDAPGDTPWKDVEGGAFSGGEIQRLRRLRQEGLTPTALVAVSD